MKVASLKSFLLCFALIGLMLVSDYTMTTNARHIDLAVLDPCLGDFPPPTCPKGRKGPMRSVSPYMHTANPYRRPCTRISGCKRD
ncbi:hypothetical protein vseg_009069 [Gypsophila vaccaria]